MVFDGTSILEMAFTVIFRIKAFDTEHNGDTNCEKLKDDCKSFVYWLLTARNDDKLHDKPLLSSADPTILSTSTTVHRNHIHSLNTAQGV